jgi:acyl CoA:acetate/3-ketoacid CoA transferase alpha subunit
MASLIK